VEIKVSLDDVSLGDVVAVTYDSYEEELRTRTLGEEITTAILDRLAADAERWRRLTERYAKVVDQHFRSMAAGYVEDLIAREVTRQLSSPDQGAVTRGEPSTKAQAIVATEVTTQLRAAFAPVVSGWKARLDAELEAETAATVEEFRRGRA
jgi:hypothetical protein